MQARTRGCDSLNSREPSCPCPNIYSRGPHFLEEIEGFFKRLFVVEGEWVTEPGGGSAKVGDGVSGVGTGSAKVGGGIAACGGGAAGCGKGVALSAAK